ncbi:MAG: hypothetical protein OEM52_00400 [bacterium]|nr:hypothetical protein [bacterium]
MKIEVSKNDVNSYLSKHQLTAIELYLDSISSETVHLKATGSIPCVPVKISFNLILKNLTATMKDGLTGSFAMEIPLLLRPFRSLIESYIQGKTTLVNFQTNRFSIPLPIELWSYITTVTIALYPDEVVLTGDF